MNKADAFISGFIKAAGTATIGGQMAASQGVTNNFAKPPGQPQQPGPQSPQLLAIMQQLKAQNPQQLNTAPVLSRHQQALMPQQPQQPQQPQPQNQHVC